MPENSISRRGGNGRNRRVTHPNRRARQESAAERLQSHALRSVEDQLLLIADRAGYSRREVRRLTGGEFDTAGAALDALRGG